MIKTLLICSVMILCGCQSEQVQPIVDAAVDAAVPVAVEILVPPQVKFWVTVAAALFGGGVIGRKTKK